MQVQLQHLKKDVDLESLQAPSSIPGYKVTWHAQKRGWRCGTGGKLFFSATEAVQELKKTKQLSAFSKTRPVAAEVDAGILRTWKHVVYHKSKKAWVVNRHQGLGMFEAIAAMRACLVARIKTQQHVHWPST